MTWTKDYFNEIYSRYLESGLNIREFCHNEGIKEQRFFKWRRRIKAQPKHEAPGKGLIAEFRKM